MRGKVLKPVSVAVVVLCLATTTLADLKIKFRYTEGNYSGESVSYFKGVRQRNEHTFKNKDGKSYDIAHVYQCDLKRFLWLDSVNRRYMENPYLSMEEAWAEYYERSVVKKSGAREIRYGGMWTETVTVTDTGERKEMFGYTARRIKTRTVSEEMPHACNRSPLRQETDGWYVDLLYGVECSSDISGSHTPAYAVQTSKCYRYYEKRNYKFERRQVGTARFGFPVALTVKAYNDGGQPMVSTREVVELSIQEIDASLFEVPPGYTKFTPQKRSLLDRALSLFGGD